VRIFDGHNDVLTRVYAAGREAEQGFLHGGFEGHIDLPRARTGGFAGGLFAIMASRDPARRRMPAAERETDGARRYGPIDPRFAQRFALSVTAGLFRLERASQGGLRVVRDTEQLRETIDSDAVAVVLHFEGAEPIDVELNALEVFYAAGLRSLGLVWSRPNFFAEGVPFDFPASPDTGPGLTDAGRHLVAACNELGIAIDLSHLNEQGFWDVAKLSSAPLIASHSNAHALCASTRNLTDAQLDAVAASGGIVGVNFSVGFSREDGRPDADTPIATLVAHFAYLAERMGVDHVGFGSDYDGTLVPEALSGVDALPSVVDALRDAGFDEIDLMKIAHENWVRVLSQTWSQG
jgi:membrane dipeptidase